MVGEVGLGGALEVCRGCSRMRRECDRELERGWRRVAAEARSTSLPTIMAVRLATVGPELGTMGGVGLRDEDVVVGEAEGLGGDLGRGWCWCPGRTRWRRRGCCGRPSGVSSMVDERS